MFENKLKETAAVVTGANGFIGTNLIKRLLLDNVHVYALILDSEKPNDVLENSLVTVIHCNLEQGKMESIDIPDNIEVLYHFAWIGVKPDDRKKIDMQYRNIQLTWNCMKLARQKKIKRFVMPGSTNEYLYSGTVINEKCIPSPRDAYGSVKVSLRYLAKQYAADNGIDFIYAVISGVYSEQRRDNNVISYTVGKLLKKESPSLTKLEQRWDYVHIDDAVEALFLIGKKGRNGKVYVIGHGDNQPLSEYIKTISRIIDPEIPLGIGMIPYSGIEMPMSCVDISDLQNDTGYKPKVTFEDGILRMIANWNIMER